MSQSPLAALNAFGLFAAGRVCLRANPAYGAAAGDRAGWKRGRNRSRWSLL